MVHCTYIFACTFVSVLFPLTPPPSSFYPPVANPIELPLHSHGITLVPFWQSGPSLGREWTGVRAGRAASTLAPWMMRRHGMASSKIGDFLSVVRSNSCSRAIPPSVLRTTWAPSRPWQSRPGPFFALFGHPFAPGSPHPATFSRRPGTSRPHSPTRLAFLHRQGTPSPHPLSQHFFRVTWASYRLRHLDISSFFAFLGTSRPRFFIPAFSRRLGTLTSLTPTSHSLPLYSRKKCTHTSCAPLGTYRRSHLSTLETRIGQSIWHHQCQL